MNIALSVCGRVLLGLTLSRPVVSVCEGFGEVTCAGGPSDAWVNSNFAGHSLPPAGTLMSLHNLVLSGVEGSGSKVRLMVPSSEIIYRVVHPQRIRIFRA